PCTIQNPHNISGYAPVQTHEAAHYRTGLGKVRRVYTDFHSPQHDAGATATPVGRRLLSFLHSAIVGSELSGYQYAERNAEVAGRLPEAAATTGRPGIL